jgi:hypothetical protein
MREVGRISPTEIVYSNNLVTLRKQSVNEGGPDEPGGTGHQHSQFDQLLLGA